MYDLPPSVNVFVVGFGGGGGGGGVDLLDDFDDTDIAHDFWLTRQGHGAGFWDGVYPDEIGDKLTEISNDFRELYIYVGDDGQLYFG